MTGTRRLIHHPILALVREHLGRRLEAVTVGPATDPSSDMGSMNDMANVMRVNGLVEDATQQGAIAVVHGGPIQDGPLAKGVFNRPPLLEMDDHRMAIVQDEVLGLVLGVQAFNDEAEAEAVRLGNDSAHGLAAWIWSRDVDRPVRVVQQIEAGAAWVSTRAVVYDESEEDGLKQSGVGRLNGFAAIENFADQRTIIHEVPV